MTSFRNRYLGEGTKALQKAWATVNRNKGNLSDYDAVFPVPEGQPKFQFTIPHPDKEPHKKCCDVCYVGRANTNDDLLKTFNREIFYCVHRLVDGKHQPCAAYAAYEKAGKLKRS